MALPIGNISLSFASEGTYARDLADLEIGTLPFVNTSGVVALLAGC